MWAARRLPRCSPIVRLYRQSHSSADKKPYYVTTPIFYPNAAPHIGHLHSLVTGDIFARFNRIANPMTHTHYLTGTDEHGLKIQKAAAAVGKSPREFCDELSQRFLDLADAAHIRSTTFNRTSDPKHHYAVEHVWNELKSRRLIHKTKYSGWYSITDECFYTPLQVTRAPKPENPDAYIAISTGSVVEWHEEENYVFRLGAFRQRLLQHYLNHPHAIYPPQYHADVIQSLQAENGDGGGLEELSISRPRQRLNWGVQVPGDQTQTVYVWFDALLVYLSGIGYPDAGAMSGLTAPWPPNLQVIGKDILRFHAIFLPAMLTALGLPLSRQILAHAHWTVNQKKMSKSVGNVADPIEAINEYGVDVVRWYLARVGGRWRSDVDCKVLIRLMDLQCETPVKVKKEMENLEVAEALQHLTDLMRVANKTFTDIAPWQKSVPVDLVYAAYSTAIETLRVLGICLQPFIPSTAKAVLDALGLEQGSGRTWHATELPGGVLEEEQVKQIGEIIGVNLF
ncbi:putative methionine--tRNA ligase, mitochondrial [Leucoagaricus sp. SymC.cos]|nr:putative methionine--tRNA ligase, mitochondrial [Leucoagaricus sp. SymC.cos]